MMPLIIGLVQKEYPFAIYNKQSEKYIGTTRLFQYEEELEAIKLGHTWQVRQFWRGGINKNFKYLLFQFCFENLKLERIGLGACTENIRSINAMKSLRCKEEGKLRNLFPSKSTSSRADARLFSILKHEWYDTVKINLNQKL